MLESFLRSRGNLRDMERELGISYPTVRTRVEALVRSLGFGPRDEADGTPESAAFAAAIATAADGRCCDRPPGLAAGRRAGARAPSHATSWSAEEAAEAIRSHGKERPMTDTTRIATSFGRAFTWSRAAKVHVDLTSSGVRVRGRRRAIASRSAPVTARTSTRRS